MKNPWELNRRHIEGLNALIEQGNEKAAAYKLGVTPQGMSYRMAQIKELMGASTPLQAAIWWDRFKRDALGPAT